MFLIRLLRYLRGYVWFEARGVFVERFLNLVARDRIAVWSGRKRGEVYTGCIAAHNYRRLRTHARKTKVKLRITQKVGAGFQRRKYRKRTGLFIGLALFVVFLMGMSQFIWRIEIGGNERVDEIDVLQALEALGIEPGTWRSSIDVRDCERKMLLLLPELSWAALNIDGSALRVEVSESTKPPKVILDSAPCNIVAGEAGQILSMYVYDGQAMVQIGDTVLPGDMIVSGITQDSRGMSLFRHAQAQVIAQVQLNLEVSVPLAQTHYIETGKIMKRGYLQLFTGEIPIFLPWSIPAPYRVNRTTTPLRMFSLELPLSWLGEEYILMEEVPVTLTEAEAKKEAMAELGNLQKARLGDAEILEREISSALEGDHFVMKAHYICNMDIAEEREILIGE